MSSSYISKELRQRVAEAAGWRCGYCLSAEFLTGATLDVDHIIPESEGGVTEEDNLWLACPRCNAHKGNRILAVDPQSTHLVPLFNPRRQEWTEHFEWSPDGILIIGRTATGRATVSALALNRTVLVTARNAWVQAGWHPPKS